MKIIVCIDENCGIMFNHRRLSSDSVVTQKIIQAVGENRLIIEPCSEKLFAKKVKNLVIDNYPLKNAKHNDFCFIENTDITDHLQKIEGLIIYNWNRRYPSDVKFPKDKAIEGKSLVSIVEFSGKSHQKITEEIYE